MPLFTEITIALVLAVMFGFLAHLLRQPAIIGFIFAGIAVGYLASPELGSIEVIEGLAPIGVALLLFLVGLEMNFIVLTGNVGSEPSRPSFPRRRESRGSARRLDSRLRGSDEGGGLGLRQALATHRKSA